MGRPPKNRFIDAEPGATGFHPRGVRHTGGVDKVEIQFDELEAIRLADLEGLYQDEAARRMGISRATFGRLLARARQKVAMALIGSRALVFQAGPRGVRGTRSADCPGCGARFRCGGARRRAVTCPCCRTESLVNPTEPAGRSNTDRLRN